MRYFALTLIILLLAGCAQKIQIIGGENAVTTGNVTVTPPICSSGSSCNHITVAASSDENKIVAIARNSLKGDGNLLSVSKGKCKGCWVVSFSTVHGFNRTDTAIFIEDNKVVNFFKTEHLLTEMSKKNCTSANGVVKENCSDHEEAIGRVLNNFCCKELPLRS